MSFHIACNSLYFKVYFVWHEYYFYSFLLIFICMEYLILPTLLSVCMCLWIGNESFVDSVYAVLCLVAHAWSRSVVSNSLQPHGLWPTRLLHPWNFPGKSTGMGCHFLSNPGIEPGSPAFQADALTSEPPGPHPLLSPKVFPSSCPLYWWCHPAISSFDALFSFCPQSFPASETFPMSWLFASSSQSIGVSASASVFLVNIQDWFPLDQLVWYCCPKNSQESSSAPQFESISSFVLSLLYGPTLTFVHSY